MKLPTAELAARRDKLDIPARFEAQHQESYARQVRAVEARRGQVEQAGADREAVEALGRREREIADQLLATRLAQALAAARIEPPAYIVKELGERLADPTRARAWDRGVQGIEGYRLEHGVKDQRSAFGREPQDALARATREAAQRRLTETQRRLGLEQQLAMTRQRSRSIERGFSIGR